jgi:hypothetical protein
MPPTLRRSHVALPIEVGTGFIMFKSRQLIASGVYSALDERHTSQRLVDLASGDADHEISASEHRENFPKS